MQSEPSSCLCERNEPQCMVCGPRTKPAFDSLSREHPDSSPEDLLTTAIRLGDAEAVFHMLRHVPLDIHHKPEFSMPFLHEAICQGNPVIFNLLLRHPAIDPNLDGRLEGEEEVFTPLICATNSGDPELFALLLSHPALAVNAVNQEGNTCLHTLAQSDHLSQLLPPLLSDPRLDVNAVNAEHQTALHLAIEAGHQEAVSLLLRHEAIDVNLSDGNNNLPLHLALGYDADVDAVRTLMNSTSPEVINRQETACGYTPLHLAVWRGHASLVKFLLERPGVDKSLRNHRGETAHDMAVAAGASLELIALLN